MPAESQQQRKWVFAVKGKKWAEAHHFDNKGKLPEKVSQSSPSPKRKHRVMP